MSYAFAPGFSSMPVELESSGHVELSVPRIMENDIGQRRDQRRYSVVGHRNRERLGKGTLIQDQISGSEKRCAPHPRKILGPTKAILVMAGVLLVWRCELLHLSILEII